MRPPAYGRALMNRRYSGWHPLYVRVIYGEDWELIKDEPFLGDAAYVALRPSSYRPGEVDWRCLAGSFVTVFDQVQGAGEIGPENSSEEGWGRFYYLMRDVSAHSGPLEFLTGARLFGWSDERPFYKRSAALFAFECRIRESLRTWPWWWPEEMDKHNAKKIHAWGAAVKGRAAAQRNAIRAQR